MLLNSIRIIIIYSIQLQNGIITLNWIKFHRIYQRSSHKNKNKRNVAQRNEEMNKCHELINKYLNEKKILGLHIFKRKNDKQIHYTFIMHIKRKLMKKKKKYA